MSQEARVSVHTPWLVAVDKLGDNGELAGEWKLDEKKLGSKRGKKSF